MDTTQGTPAPVLAELYDQAQAAYHEYLRVRAEEPQAITKKRRAHAAWAKAHAEMRAAGGTPTAIMVILQARGAAGASSGAARRRKRA